MTDDPCSLPSSVPMTERKNKKRKLHHVEGEVNCESEEETAVTLAEQEEALVTLIDYRAKEVDHLHKKTNYYKSQLEEAERSLKDLHSKLARLRSKSTDKPGRLKAAADVPTDVSGPVKQERSSASPPDTETKSHSKPQIVIPSVKPKFVPPDPSGQAVKLEVPSAEATATIPSLSGSANTLKQKASHRPTPVKETSRSQTVGKARRKSSDLAGNTESRDLIPSVRTCASASLLRLQSSTHIGSQHNRRLRCLQLNPSNDQHFFTSALDGVVNLWELQGNGSSASLLSSTNCSSLKGRWPEDINWHPNGDCLFAAYTADGGDSQIAIINFSGPRDKRVTFLEGKPHHKGIINNIQFMPWMDLTFATGGSDHAVILWREKDDGRSWKPETVHKNFHSSAVNGVAGMQQKKVILSVGADKRIIGYDLQTTRADFKHQIDSKCMSVLPNPLDFNLFMVQAGTPGKQLRLFDIRLRQTEIHAFGWKQESSDSQSALINQAWSSDGFHISSGSADPMIHIFDIRYNGGTPSQSLKAHQKRVFKASWHHSLPLLLSISSDLNVGLHRIC